MIHLYAMICRSSMPSCSVNLLPRNGRLWRNQRTLFAMSFRWFSTAFLDEFRLATL
jgi:hypothetical protein